MTTNQTRRSRDRTLKDFATLPWWVAWREETRTRQDGTVTKVKPPYDPTSTRQARTDDQSTWGTREQAEQRSRQLDDGRKSGVGIVLGPLDDGTVLMGVDLDTCLAEDSDKIADWGVEIIKRFDTYAEVSPSDTGVKLFFLVAAHDADAAKQLFGRNDRGKWKLCKHFSLHSHREIAIHRGGYFTVTGNILLHVPETLRTVGLEDLRWFVEVAGPRYLQQHNPASSTGTTTRTRRDESGSGYGSRFMRERKAAGDTYEAACTAIRADSGPAGEWARRSDERQLRRAWENASGAAKPRPTLTAAVTAKQLLATTFDPIKYVVPELIVEGLTLFAGKPKIGKSWLVLDLGVGVSCGDDILGGIRCPPGDVLYCPLEDNKRRIHSRLKQIGVQRGSEHLTFRFDLPRLNDGGVEVIRDWIEAVEHPRLVIIDTLQKVRPKGAQETQYASDYEALSGLQALALSRGIAIVVVHHQRKLDAADPFDTISGTLGLTGAPDSILILRRDGNRTLLQGKGRDLSEFAKAVAFERETCRWTIIGDADEVRTSNERQAILDAMREIGGPASPREIGRQSRLKTENVSKLLQKMARQGQVIRNTYGKYKLAPAREG